MANYWFPQNVKLFSMGRVTTFVTRLQRQFHQDEYPPNAAYTRKVPNLPALQLELVKKPPEKVPGSKLLRVAILGVPNAGKSTLINQLTGWKTCAVSKKVHTTRKVSKTVVIADETQIVFLDTPGLVEPSELKRHQLEASFIFDPEKALMQADLLVVMHDVGNKQTRMSLSPKILRLLHLYPEKKSVLVFNKIDQLKEKRCLLSLTDRLCEGMVDGASTTPVANRSRTASGPKSFEFAPTNSANVPAALTPGDDSNPNASPSPRVLENLSEKQVAEKINGKIGWPHFSRVFMISALDGDGIADIRDYLLNSAKPGRWLFNSQVVTDQDPQEMTLAIIREKLLNLLSNELPYKVALSVRFWEVDLSGALNVVIGIDARKAFTARVIVGSGGRTVIQIAHETEQELRNLFRSEVKLRLIVEPDHRHEKA